MCGRYTLAGKPIDLEKQLRANLLHGVKAEPSYNISPGIEVLAVTNDQPDVIRAITWDFGRIGPNQEKSLNCW